MDEEELIRGSQSGDLECFNKLVERYQVAVYNLALRMLGNAPAAEDAAQDAFLSAWKSIRSFRGGSFKAWMLRITANTCRDQLRWLRRRPITSLEALGGEIPSRDSSPEDYARGRELEERIHSGLAALPPDQRLAVILSDIQGLSYEEIAQVMNCSIGTVRSRLSRGRARLRDRLLQGNFLD